jgi:uncharacterized protein
MLLKRRLGKTNLSVTAISFGGLPLQRCTLEEAGPVLAAVLDQGINFIDTARAYTDSEEKMGYAFEGVREKVVLATKTVKRDGQAATKDLEDSLRLLRTDHIDLYQLHQVAHEEEWAAATAPGGALEAVLRARDEGKVRCIGVSSHNLAMAVKLVKTGLFSTIQFPFNFIEEAAKDELHTAARNSGMGILAMKPFAGGMIPDAEAAFKFLRQYPDVVPIPGFDSVEAVDEVVAFYEHANVVTEKDLRRMEEYRKELGKQFCRRCEYCQPCPKGVMITAAMAYKVIASRMSASVAIQFSKAPMESVTLCNECGTCLERCPYELPIPEMLKAGYDLYERHRAESA